ncbi:MAG TPA: branched-chain amino acid ABC transporter substrate-binding protein [Candidatus Eremiobacteraceae bacterium]|nr:branched-chain amino acid ABC transporter substrate-binding protein [Candidatus Eremiobacteraceae bacterium]
MLRTIGAPRTASAALLVFILAFAGCSGSGSGSNSTSSGTAGATSGSNAAAGNIIKIGADLPISGADASDGVPTKLGVELAIIDANKQNLVPGFTLQSNILDDAVNGVHNPSQGAKNVQSFASDDAVLGIVGPFNSNVAKAEIPLTNSLGIALISPATTNPDLTKGPRALELRTTNPQMITFFRVCATDDIQGPVGADYAYNDRHLRKAYLIDDNETYGRGVADAWGAQFTNDGGTVLAHDHITKGQQDFHALLTRAAGAGPDVVFYGGVTANGGGLIRKQMSESGIGNVAYFGADGVRNDQFLTDAGATADNVYATVAAVNASTIPAAKQFLTDYQAQFNQPVGSYSAAGYTAAMVLIKAIGLASKADGGKMPTRAQVLSELRSIKSFQSIMGPFAFDANGDTTNKIISIWGAQKDKWVFLTQRKFAAK